MESLFGNRQIRMKTLLDFSAIEPHVQAHLKRTYSTLMVMMAFAALGAFEHVAIGLIKGGFLTSLLGLVAMLVVAFTSNEPKNAAVRLGALFSFAALQGLSVGPLVGLAVSLDPSIVVTAFLGSSAIFTCLTLSALVSPRRQYLFLGGILSSGLSLLLLLGLVNLFVGVNLLFNISLYGGLLLFCGFVLFDTQLLIEKRRNGDTDFIWHSVDLFLDFLNIFIRILVILTKDQKRRRDD
jgi:FtsH-binding integral membrane protein